MFGENSMWFGGVNLSRNLLTTFRAQGRSVVRALIQLDIKLAMTGRHHGFAGPELANLAPASLKKKSHLSVMALVSGGV